MREVVLDSSVFIASLMPDELSEKAEQLIRQLDVSEARYHAPILLRYEVIAAARKAVYRKRMNAEQGRILRESLLAYRMTLYFDDALLRRAYWFISQVMQVYASDKDGRAHSSSRWQPELPDAWR